MEEKFDQQQSIQEEGLVQEEQGENQKGDKNNVLEEDSQQLQQELRRSISKKAILVFIALLTIIIILAGSFLIFGFIRKDTKSDEVVKAPAMNAIEKKQAIEDVIREYYEIKKYFVENFDENKTGIKPNDSGSFANKFFYTKKALAQEEPLARGAIVARGLATFLEIGRKKDISEAEQINNEDIQYIKLAKNSLGEMQTEVISVNSAIRARVRAGAQSDEKVVDFLSFLLDQYEKMDLFLDEILVYKEFHATELSAVDTQELTRLAYNSFRILGELARSNDQGESSSQEMAKNLKSINEVYKKSIENLKKVEVPEKINDRSILEDRLLLRIKTYETNIKCNNELIENSQKPNDFTITALNNLKQAEGETGGQASCASELNELKSQMEQNLSTYTNNSKVAQLFHEILKGDSELKIKAGFLGDEYDLSFFVEDDIYLEDLMGEFYRKEQSDLHKSLDELSKTMKESLPRVQKNQEVVIDKNYTRIIVTIFMKEDAGEVSFNLKSPSGRVVTKELAEKEEDVRFGDSRTYQLFEIKNPEMGRWDVLIESSQGEEIELKVATF